MLCADTESEQLPQEIKTFQDDALLSQAGKPTSKEVSSREGRQKSRLQRHVKENAVWIGER